MVPLSIVFGLFFSPIAHANPVGSHDESAFSAIHGKSGFWRVAKTKQGVWWFVSPKGQVDFLNTVTTVQPEVRGRDPMGPDFVSRDFNDRNPSTAALNAWANCTVQRVRDAGFKGIGAWSNPALHNCDIPMTQDLNLSSWTRGGSGLVYSPQWSSTIEYAIKTQVQPLRDNHNLVGYYLDNEMDWTDEAAGPRTYFDGLPPGDPNRQQVLGTIRNTWPSIDAFNKDWNTKIGDWQAMDSWRALPQGTTSAYDKLLAQWTSHLAESYFQTTTSLLRKYDPNHLVLGIRYRGYAPRQVVRASRGYTDAQSINYYVSDARLDADLFKMISTESDQPIVISEYSFHALDGRSGDRNTVGFDAQVVDQKARGEAYRAFTTRLARVPYVIGADWFQWMDEPPSGRQGDGEDVNFGVVDVDDKPYQPLVDSIRATTPLLNDLHEGSDKDKAQDVWRHSYAGLPVFHVPLLEKPIRIDGELSDWPAACRLPGMKPPSAVGSERNALREPNVYVGWSPEGMSIGFEVFDSDVAVAPPSGAWWARDCVEFWISTRPVKADEATYDQYCHHFFFVPVDQPAGDGISGVVGQWHCTADAVIKCKIPDPSVKTVTRILPDKYVTEIFIPAGDLNGYDPVHQPQLAFNINVRNYQHAAEYFWSAPKQVLTQARPATWGALYLSQPSQSPREGGPQLPVANIAEPGKP
ncbi:MAG TPA: hypothetical protein VFE47_05160 [Tepidisphaeraceae bacterium]|nr:hypothetical protein [Tepidisphaeraceae bacterium]